MATIYADAQGNLLRFLHNAAEEARYPDLPTGATQTVTYDEVANASVSALLDTDWNSFSVVSNVLQRNGTPVTIAADSSVTAARKAVAGQAAAVLAALQAGTATNAQVQKVLAVLLHSYIQSN